MPKQKILNKDFTLKVDRDITLKIALPNQAKAIYTTINANRKYLDRFLPWVKETKRVQDTQKFLKTQLPNTLVMENLVLSIWYQEIFAGMISLQKNDPYNKGGVIGYWLAQEYEGMGIMTKGVNKLIEFAFKKLKLHRIEIECAIDNVKSQKIPEKLGFHREAIMKEAINDHGKYVDSILYAKINLN